MRSEPAISISSLGKAYRLYAQPLDRILDAFGITWLPGRGHTRFREFWALRGLDLIVPRGQRLGIIGRNGAGKSSLLRIIAGKNQPNEGVCGVTGRVQALMELGTGFHPEFSGRENIRASLAYQDLSDEERTAREADIIAFTELEDFIEQPVKTYSAGMYARLAFAAATAIEPEVLIIDEVLGAGDAYFARKCVDRMRRITDSSKCTVLFVSHDLASVQMLCERAVWIERGHVSADGESLDVIRTYQEFIKTLEDRRLRIKNAVAFGGRAAETTRLVFTAGAGCDILVRKVVISGAGTPEESLAIGGVQDESPLYPFHLVADSGSWRDPELVEGVACRRLLRPSGSPPARGEIALPSHVGDSSGSVRIRIEYLGGAGEGGKIAVEAGGRELTPPVALDAYSETWTTAEFVLEGSPAVTSAQVPEGGTRTFRWASPLNESIRIESVVLRGPGSKEQAVFSPGSTITIEVTVLFLRALEAELKPSVAVYRPDGILVARFVGNGMPATGGERTKVGLLLEISPVLFGDGEYVLSVALFDRIISEETRFDLIDRSIHFSVFGNPPEHAQTVAALPGRWSLDRR